MTYRAGFVTQYVLPLILGAACMAGPKPSGAAERADSTAFPAATERVWLDYAASTSLAQLPGAELQVVDARAVPPVSGYKLQPRSYQWPRFNQLTAPLRRPLQGAVGGAYVGMMLAASGDWFDRDLATLAPRVRRLQGDDAVKAAAVGAAVGAVAYPVYKWIRPD